MLKVHLGLTNVPGVTEPTASDRLRVREVEGTAIGITPDQAARIFDPFYQAESGYTRVRGGTGLGLAISRTLARMMGGDVTVRSESGVGSCFTLYLPPAPQEDGNT